MSGVLHHAPQRIIQQLLLDLGGLVTDPGDNLAWPAYVGSLPDAADGSVDDNVVAVRDTEGEAQGREMTAGYLFEKHGIQIMVRSDGPVDGYVKAARILQALNGVHNRDVDLLDDAGGTITYTYRVQSVRPTTPVIRMGPEPQSRRYRWSLNSLVSVRLVT